jgi:hypothetical protein
MLAVMRKHQNIVHTFVVGLCLLSAHARGAEPIKVPMSPEHWKTNGSVGFGKHDGFDALELKPYDRATKTPTGNASPVGISFRNGTIEFDVDKPWSMGTGIAFRRDNDKSENFEYFYLRPQANCAEAVDCIQYAPQTHGVLLWDVLPQFQAPAPLREGEWNHVKLVVSGQRMNIFVNGAKSPTLKVGRLEGDTSEGGLLLSGPGFFANVTVTPDAVDGLPAEPAKDPTASDRRYLRSWKVSPFYPLEAGKDPRAVDLPGPTAAWTNLAAERNGFVNLSRPYGVPMQGKLDRPVAWMKTNITSDGNQTKKVSIGWLREVWVFVNGQQVYADKNFYQPPSARKMPDGRCSLENGSFELPLKAGVNEIEVAIASNFYGWGLIMRLDDVNGVRLETK